MTTLLRGSLSLLAFALNLLPQQQPGVSAEWDIGKTLQAISAHIAQLQPILDQIRPKEWIEKGAPDTYMKQWESSVSQAKSVAISAQTLARQPANVVEAMQFLFRMQSLDSSLNSVKEGLRKYQNPPLADMLSSVSAENTNNRDKFQQYVLDLATEKEQQFQVADREAQRCRESLSKQPPARRPR